MRPLSSRLLLALPVFLGAAATACGQELLVSGYNSDEVHRFDYASGSYLGPLASVNGAHAVNHGPDGLLYVAAEEDDQILRFDPVTLAFIDAFVKDDPTTPQDETGGLDGPTTAIFGADGNLYVASFNTNAILRYDGATGAYIDDFVPSGRGGLNGPDAGTTFGPDGHLYVPSYNNDRVLRFDGATGAPLGDFVAAGAGGLDRPRTLRFRSDGVLYVSSEGSDAVLRFDRGGHFLDAFIAQKAPTGFVLSPFDGNVLVASVLRNVVTIFDGGDGHKVGTLVKAGDGGLSGPVSLNFRTDPYLHLGRITPGTTGAVNTLALANGTAATTHFLLFGLTPGSFRVGGCPEVWLGLADPHLLPLVTDSAGAATLSGTLDPALAGVTLLLQAFDPATCRMATLVEQTLQ